MQHKILLLTIGVVAVGLINPVLSQAPCRCERKGNTYTVSSTDSCTSFTQSTSGHPDRKLDCPAGLRFNTRVCVCDHPDVTDCSNSCAGPTGQPASPLTAQATQSCLDTGSVYERVNMSIDAGDCRHAGENIVVFDLNCQRGVDRAEDMYALFPLYYTYIGAGCLENDDNLTSLPPACDTLVECTTQNPSNDFTAGCGVNDQKRFNALGCYSRYAGDGCTYAGVLVKRFTKLLAELCPRSCEAAAQDNRTRVIARAAAEAGRCDIAMALLWDDTVSCNDSADLSGAFSLSLDATRFLYEICDELPEPTIEPSCWPLEQCFHLTNEGSFRCGETNIEHNYTVQCLAEITQRGCYFTPALTKRYTAYCPRY